MLIETILCVATLPFQLSDDEAQLETVIYNFNTPALCYRRLSLRETQEWKR